jgi:hypothetical protein
MIEEKRIFKIVESKSRRDGGGDGGGADDTDDVNKTQSFTQPDGNQQEWDADDSAGHSVPGDVSPGRVKKPFEEVMCVPVEMGAVGAAR